MKIIFIVLLIAAIGAGVYYYFSKKQKPVNANNPKELIISKWKIDSLDLSRSKDSSLNIIALIFAATDSNLHNYEFRFDKNGLITESLNGKAGDTSYYEFTTDKDLLVWSKADTIKTKWSITKLDSVKLILQTSDSTIFSFSKVHQ